MFFTASAQQTLPSAAAIRLNNLGVAYMSQARVADALASFRQAAARDPSFFTARLNEGIALLNLQRLTEARDVLLDATRRQPENARAWYNLGITYRTLAATQSAIEAFNQVRRVDPSDADTLYFLGQLYMQGADYQQAIAMFEKCLALDPLHVSAEFGLARSHQLAGNDAAAARHLERFDQLTQSKLGKPISQSYGEQGPYSTAEPEGVADAPPTEFSVRFSAAAPRGVRFEPRPATEPIDSVGPLLGPGACFIDFDADGRHDLLLPGGPRQLSLYRNTGGGFTDVTTRAGFNPVGGFLGCTIGDYDNDGRSDIAAGLQNGIAVYRNLGNGAFSNVTSNLGIRSDGLALGVTFVDYDHDGDLDLYICRFSDFPIAADRRFDFPFAPAMSNVLWRNNGNGTFTDATVQTGLAGDAPGIAALPVDLDNDRAVDFVLTAWRRSAVVLTNPREGTFRASEPWGSAFPSPAAGVAAFDFNKDGWMDLAFTHWGQPGLTVWKNISGTRFDRINMPEVQWARGWGLTIFDADNDGWLDLAATGERAQGPTGSGEIRVLRNIGEDRFADVSAMAVPPIGLDQPRALISGDTDGDGDADLLITRNAGPPLLLRNNGGNRQASVRLAFRGLNDNRAGIGTKVEVFAGALRQKWEVTSSSGYLGQNAPEIIAGLGGAREADIVRLLWPTGVIQDEVQLARGRRHLLNEIDRRGSSCPVVWVWNGERYEFISDMIGPGIVGHWVGPGQRNTPDPTEYLKIGGDQIKAKNGRLSFRFAEVMEELVYLDQVRLLAIDHPADTDIYPNEYFAAAPPFPEFKVVTTRGARLPREARDGRGRNVLPDLSRRDRRYVTGFDALRFPGFAEMHYLELDLGAIDTSGPLRLLMHGFIEYFSATSVFAAHQAGITAAVPFLEIQTPGGEWKRVLDDIGFPAGLARTMVADLTGKLPSGATRIRIGTNLKIYWDQILVDTTAQTSPVEIHGVPLAEASSRFLGYPRQAEGTPRSDLRYIYEDVSPTGPYARHSGNFTAYGNVLSLLNDADDRFVIMGSGDEVALEFDPSGLPPVRAGWSRDYFFYADGFAKDMDFYEAHSNTVEPLPFHSMGEYPYGPSVRYPTGAAYLAYRLNTNTRHITGNVGIQSFRFRY